MATVLSRLDILLHANTANYRRDMQQATDQTKKELKSVADYSRRIGSEIGNALSHGNSLGAILTTIGGIGLTNNIMQTADRMQDLASKVRINTQSTEEYNAVLHDLRKISTDYWTAIDGITDLYASSKRALDSLGVSQRQVLDFTRNITMAMSIGSGSTQAQEAALIQLGQAMSMGVLRGQEFNSVSAQAPVIIDLLTDSLKVSRGELRKMASEGKITSQIMLDAVLGGYDKLQDTINKMPTTFAQGVQNIKSQYDFLVDDIMNQNSLLSQNLANVALWVAENFRTLVSAGAMIGAVWLANIAKNSALATSFIGLTSATLANTKASIANAFSVQGQINAYNVLSTRMMLLRMTKTHYINLITTAITATANYGRSLLSLAGNFNTATAAARLHTLALAGVTTAKRTAMGVGILATRAVTGLGGAFMSLGRVILAHPIITLTAVIGAVIARTEGLSGAVQSLGDAFNVAGILAVDFISGVVDGLGMAWTAASNYFDNLMGGAGSATSFTQTAFGGFFANTEKGFVGVLQIIARVFDKLGAIVVGTVKTANQNFMSFLRNIHIGFVDTFNAIAKIINSVVGGASKMINYMLDGVSQAAQLVGISAPSFRLSTSDVITIQDTPVALPTLSLSQNIANSETHALENAVLNADKQVQANKELSKSYGGLTETIDKATEATNKKAEADKKAKKAAEEAAKTQKDLVNAYFDQIKAYKRYYEEGLVPYLFESRKMAWETGDPDGKFFNLPQILKDDLNHWAAVHDRVDVYKATQDKVNDYINQSNALVSKTMLDELEASFADRTNILHYTKDYKEGSAQYDDKKDIGLADFLRTAALNAEYKKAGFEFSENQKALGLELKLANQSNEIRRQFLEFEQENQTFIDKYQSIKESKLFASDFEALKKLADEHTAFQKHALAIKESSEFAQDADKDIADYQNQLDALQAKGGKLSEELYGIENQKLQTLEKYQALQDAGFTKEFEHIKAKAEELALTNQKLVVQTAYKNLTDSLMSDEEKRLETLKEQLNIINAQSIIMGENVDIERAKQLISQSIGLATPTNPFDELDTKTKGQYDNLDAGLKKLLENERLTEEERIKIKEWGAAERTKIEKAHNQAMNSLILSNSENIFGSLASIAKDGLGEQSKLYRAMFAMQQGFAIAQAGIAVSQAMSQGLAKGFPKGLSDMAMAAAHGAKIISAIKSVVMPVGQAHDGIMSVPKSGTWNLEKGERVLPKHTAQNLDNTLNRLQGNSGGQVINVNVTVNADHGDVQSSHDMGKNLGNAIKLAVQAELQKERRQGGMLYGR